MWFIRKTLRLKLAHAQWLLQDFNKRLTEWKATINTCYTLSCYHVINNNAIWTVYVITGKAGLTSVNTWTNCRLLSQKSSFSSFYGCSASIHLLTPLAFVQFLQHIEVYIYDMSLFRSDYVFWRINNLLSKLYTYFFV